MARVGDWGFEGGHDLMFSSMAGISVTTLGAITGQYGVQGNLGPGGAAAVLPFPAALSEFFIGLNLRSTSYSTTGALFGWRKTGTILGSIRQTAGRQLTLYVGASLVATGTKVLVDNQTYNFQLGIKIHDSTGYVTLKVDGVTDINYTASDTKPGADADVNEWQLGNAGIAAGGGIGNYDDLILNDTTGGVNNSFPGIRYFYPALPTGDSATNNALSRSTGSNGWALVDERPHNITDYVFSGTNGQQQGFTHAASGVPAASIVKSVRFDYIAWMISSGQLKVGTKSGSTEDLSAAQSLGISPTVLTAYYENDPDTAAAWASIAAADAAESLVESVI